MRKEKGYNKYEMSIQADIHYTYYLSIENGRLIPNFKGLISIVNALNTDISHLLSEKSYSKTEILKTDILSKLTKVTNEDFLIRLLNILIAVKLWSDTDEEL